MTKEELATLKKDLELREAEIEKEMGELSKEQHEIHMKMREYYKQYIDEHFPYKVGDKLKYTFTNGDGDEVTREIEVTEISSYKCRLSQIIIFYKWKDTPGWIDYINIDGNIPVSSLKEKLEKI